MARDGTAIESVVHITMPGNKLLREIHNTGGDPYRMPAILREVTRRGSVARSRPDL
jgi:hypothetical protein